MCWGWVMTGWAAQSLPTAPPPSFHPLAEWNKSGMCGCSTNYPNLVAHTVTVNEIGGCKTVCSVSVHSV